MTTVSYPGVYIEEVAGGAKPIELAGSSTAALVGVTEKGPVGTAVRISSWDQYRRNFGGFVADSYLAESVFALFNNGGRQCDIVRIARADAVKADLTLKNRAATPAAGVRFLARNPGAWANSLLLTVEDSSDGPGNGFKLTLRQQVESNTVPASLNDLAVLEVHDNLGMDAQAVNYFVDVLARDSGIVTAELAAGNNTLQAGFCLGEALANVPRPASVSNQFKISIDGDAFQTVTLDTPPASANYGWDDLVADIKAKVGALTPLKTSVPQSAYTIGCTADSAPNSTRRLRITSGTADHIRSAVLVQSAPTNNIADRLGLSAGSKARTEGALAHRRPANVASAQLGDASINDPAVSSTPVLGDNGQQPVQELDYFNAFSALDGRTDVSLLLAPGVGTLAMQGYGASYCENRPILDMFYIGEVGARDETPEQAALFRGRLAKPSSYSALYYPWVLATDPSGRSAMPVRLPPSGYIAGLYSRIDAKRGVWKAPAGTEASLSGVVGLVSEITDVQQGTLNPMGVNVLRRVSLAGIVSWGARTAGVDLEYKYVPVRRLAIMLRRSIYDGIQWAVFEPNDERLWSSLRLEIDSLLNSLFRAGAFQGDKASDAYSVRCGLGSTMTQGDIDRGQVIVEVGFAPVKPAEFVIVRIQQKVGQQ